MQYYLSRQGFRSVFVALFFFCFGLNAFAQTLPSVKQRVDAFNQEMANNKDMPKPTDEDMAIMKKADDAMAQTLPNPGLKIDDKAPDFTLTNAFGKPVRLADYLKKGPVILVFYRGAWCPYCNIHMHALLESLPAFKKYKANLIAITPQMPDKSAAQIKKDKLSFDVLSDSKYEVIKAYNLYFELTPQAHKLYKNKFGLDIETFNGNGRLGLPVPATFVINQGGRIVAMHAELDYKQRMEPQAILDALKIINRK